MKLPLKEKLAYGLADIANNLVMVPTMNFLLYYYTDVFGLTAAAVGTLLLSVRLADGVIDVGIGVAADRTRTRWGKYRPWLLWAAAPFGVLGVLTFTTPDWSGGAKLLYAWTTYLLLMTALSAITIPLGALSAVMTDDPHERTRLNGIRFACANGGAMLAAVATLPLVNLFSGPGHDPALGYPRTLMLYGAVAFGLFLVTFLGTRERVLPAADQKHDLGADLAMLRHNRPWLIVTGAAMLIITIVALRYAVPIYYFKYYVGNESGAGPFLTVMTASYMGGALVSAPVSRRWGKRTAFKWAAFIAAVPCALLFLLSPSDGFLLMAGNAVASLVFGSIHPLMFSMLADAADYGEWQCGRRSAGIIFSGLALGLKVGFGVGGALTGALLVAFGYVAGAAQGEEALRGMALMMSVIPAMGLVLVSLVISFYPLDEHRSAVIRQDLARRKMRAAVA